jgi:hypothetical protein
MTTSPGRTGQAVMLGLALFAIYNANGREIGGVDSQPAKFTAREVAVRHTLTLDHVVAQFPQLAERASFARDRDGHIRNAYPMLPALIASVPATVGHALGLIDMEAPLAPNLIASVTASALTSAGVALVFLAVSRLVPSGAAWLTAAALGIGTNLWPVASRTLWQHETVTFGLGLALFAWLVPTDSLRTRDRWIGGIGLALAGAARPQVAPIVLVMLIWLTVRIGVRRAAVPIAIVAIAAAITMAMNIRWFGHPFGAAPQLESIHPQVHGVPSALSTQPWVGLAGLLLSPSRGLLIFSPVLAVALAGLGPSRQDDWRVRVLWLGWAAAVQLVLYSFYAVWWGGHTYGPRYTLDLLVPLAPALALGFARLLTSRAWTTLAAVALVWSVGVAALGAFVYPNEFWNTSPDEVDQHHERLWNFGDSQIRRVWTSAPSPQNFDLFGTAAFRRPPG